MIENSDMEIKIRLVPKKAGICYSGLSKNSYEKEGGLS